MVKALQRCVPAWLGLLAVLVLPVALHAEVGLVLETPTGPLGFFSDVGHASIWISHGCLSPQGEVRYCEHSQGIVLTSTSYWPNPGAAAIPAELFFLGSRPGPAGHGERAWNDNLAAAYPSIDREMGRKYLGRADRRGIRVLSFSTTPEDDRRVLAEVERLRHDYRYSYIHRNCAFYAESVLKLYLGDDFRANRVLDFGVLTPRALERALRHRLEDTPDRSFRVVRFKDSGAHSWRQPPRNICESALFDPKYAIPLAFFQPHLYIGFGVCYGINRITGTRGGRTHDVVRERSPSGPQPWDLDPHLTAFETLTGPVPGTSLWSSPAPAAELPPTQAAAEVGALSPAL